MCLGLLGIMALMGCGAISEQVRVEPLRGQSEGRRLLDMRDCDPGTISFRTQTIRAYASCMISRGYRAYVEVELIDVQDNLAFPGGILAFEVQADTSATASDASSVLSECDHRANEAIRGYSRTAKWLRTFFAALLLGANIHAGSAEKAYIICLAEKGYTALRWSGNSP